MVKVSLVVTVRNEESSIEALLRSVSKMTRLPDEMIIVDGGSTDKTISVIGLFGQECPEFPIRILREPGNIAHGRNFGIEAAKHLIIAVTDAGCILDKHWLERLVAPFDDKDVGVVAGYYTPTGDTFFQKCVGVYMSVMPDALDVDNFLPSSRSIAFKKSAWKKVGGYDEKLDTAEDLVFASAMKMADLTFVTAPDSLVYWEQRSSWKSVFTQFYRYAQGDGKALYFRPQTPLLVLRMLMGLFLVWYAVEFPSMGYQPLGLYAGLYIAFSVAKNWRYVPDVRALFYLPALQIMSDMAVLVGMLHGVILRYV
ncbi:glycosyltransferase [Candidatus Woesebacteria bacterium]|nr:glycosyltransferase [Candidatus Woesebacteria bacterium]